MKRLIFVLFFITGLAYGMEADLKLYSSDSDAPMGYYETMDSLFYAYIDSNDISIQNMGHLGLAFLEFAYGKYDVDEFFGELEFYGDSIGADIENIFLSVDDFIAPIFTTQMDGPEDFLHNIAEFFSSGDYSAFKADFEIAEESLNNSFGKVDSIFIDVDEKISPRLDTFAVHFEWMWNDSTDYSFTLELVDFADTSTQFIFSREAVDRMKDFGLVMEDFGDAMDEGFSILDSLSYEETGNSQAAIDTMIFALTQLRAASDTLISIITEQPFAPLDINTDELHNFQDAVDSLILVLEGKEFELEGHPGYTIKPVAILENLPWGFEGLYYGFYYDATSQSSYTFGGIFPNGLPAEWLDKLAVDMILNTEATEAEKELYFTLKEEEYDLVFTGVPIIGPAADPTNGDAHTGLALIEFFRAIDDLKIAADDLFYYLDMGYVDSALFHYDWERLDKDVEMEGVINHLEYIAYVDTEKVFTIVIKDGWESSQGITLVEGDKFFVLYITPEVAEGMIHAYEAYRSVKDALRDGINAFATEIDSLFDVYLDPNLIDFSNVETELDLINALEAANPDFMALSDYGKQSLRDLGIEISEMMEYLTEFTDSLLVAGEAFAPFAADFDINSDEMMDVLTGVDSMVQEISDDLNIEGETIFVDNETVNLSAWFDNPPNNLLQVWKNFVTGQDSTLWGIFPDRPNYLSIYVEKGIPSVFNISKAYPNPFNAVTTINIDLPEKSDLNIRILNINGQMIERDRRSDLEAGSYQYVWNADNYSSGIYFVRMSTSQGIATRKITLLK